MKCHHSSFSYTVKREFMRYFQKQPPEVFSKNSVIKNFAKFLRIPILNYFCERLLLYFWNPNYKQVENFIFDFRIYKIFSYFLNFVNFDSNECLLLRPSRLLNSSNVLFSSSLNRLKITKNLYPPTTCVTWVKPLFSKAK